MNMRFSKTLSFSAKEQTNLLASVLVFLLCATTSTLSMTGAPLLAVARYASVILCAIFSMFVYRYVSGITVLLFLCAAISGILNFIFIGNSTYTNLLYTLMSVFIALLFCTPCVSPRSLLYAMYFHAVMVAYCFARYGLHVNIYLRSSNNYVSCNLLLPVTVYYSLLEWRGERIPKLPALIVFILSVLAMGRGGVFSSGILLAGVLFRSFKDFRPIHRAFLVTGMVIGTVVMIRMSSSLEIASRFNRNGMSDNGRFPIWMEYLHSVFKNDIYFWLGAKFKGLPLVTYHENNLHNSFLNIHAFNGALMLILLFCLSLYTVYYAIRRKRLIFLTCMASLFFRGLTDRLLWGATGTPFMLFFLMMPHFDSLYQMRWRRWQLEKSSVKTRLLPESYF